MNYFETLNDGAPCEGKLSCTVLSGGKSGDCIKGLPIAIGSGHSVCMPGLYADGAAVYLDYYRGMMELFAGAGAFFVRSKKFLLNSSKNY